MKRPIAILLIAIHAFNFAGYTLVFDILIKRSDSQLVARLDKSNYDERNLVEVKIPLNLPYLLSSTAYERCDGSIEHQGIIYNYVKRRVFNDTLSVLCIPNQQKTSILKESRLITKEINGFPAGKKSKQDNLKKTGAAADFCNVLPDYSIAGINPAKALKLAVQPPSCFSLFRLIPERPPQLSC
ncbi:MAG: hypothetical protein ABWZ25_15485 [Chitinophagaceae bacterium]